MAFNCNGKLLDFEAPKVMGILNLSPDSFYDGRKYNKKDDLIRRTEQMLCEGAHIIDLGASSSRPGANLITKEEEEHRLLPAMKLLSKKFPNTIFSVDTYRSEIAALCYDNGAGIINDISGGNMDPKMFDTIALIGIPYILMHMYGAPKDMQHKPLKNNITKTVKAFFEKKVLELNKLGINDIILDPGYGFGKSLECNFQLLKYQDELKLNSLPLLAGLSRKSMINKVLDTKPEDALNGTSVLNLIALQNGASIVRVHDVKEAVQTIKLFIHYENTKECQ